MFGRHRKRADPGIPGPELVSEFATWIERVTERPATDYKPRHRAAGSAVLTQRREGGPAIVQLPSLDRTNAAAQLRNSGA